MQTAEIVPAEDVERAQIELLDRDPYVAILRAWQAEINSPRTREQYLRNVERFRESCPALAQAQPAQIHAFAYAVGPSGRQPSPATITARLSALASLFDFLRRMRMIERNPADDVKRPKRRQPQPRGLSIADLQLLFGAIPATTAGLRDRAVIETVLYTGLRRTEVLTLTAGQLETEDGRVFYRVRAKGGVERFREIPPPALAAIARYWAAQGSSISQLDAGARLFPISSIGFYTNLRRYAKKAGLGDLKPHDLRHTAAKLRRQAGDSLETVQALLGHRSIATTAIYIATLEPATDSSWQGVASLIASASSGESQQ
jgi:site-specific recombinase XerD